MTTKTVPPKSPTEAEKARAAAILDRLEAAIPEAETALVHDTPFQLLIATILSAQCTDVRVNQVTPRLFKTFPGPKTILEGNHDLLVEIIRPTGFYRNKAKAIIGCARRLVEAFGGEVPDTLEALVTLPGVGRKTANVVLGSAFGRPAVVVDTHVRRVANRLGLSRSRDPVKIEADLRRLLPPSRWTSGSHRLLLHGRHCCKARRPQCERCPLYDLCPAEEKGRRGAAPV